MTCEPSFLAVISFGLIAAVVGFLFGCAARWPRKLAVNDNDPLGDASLFGRDRGGL